MLPPAWPAPTAWVGIRNHRVYRKRPPPSCARPRHHRTTPDVVSTARPSPLGPTHAHRMRLGAKRLRQTEVTTLRQSRPGLATADLRGRGYRQRCSSGSSDSSFPAPNFEGLARISKGSRVPSRAMPRGFGADTSHLCSARYRTAGEARSVKTVDAEKKITCAKFIATGMKISPTGGTAT